MSLLQSLWMMIALQFALFGLGWLGAIALARESRRAFLGLAGFNLAHAASLALIALRGTLPDALTYVPPDLFVLLAYLVLWHAGELLIGRVDNTRERLAVFLVAGGAVVWFGAVTDQPQARAAAVFFGLSWLACRASWGGYSALRSEHGALPARLLLLTGWSVAAMAVIRATRGLAGIESSELHHEAASTAAMAFAIPAGVFVVNFVIAYVVLGRALRTLDRLSHQDSLTGLSNRRAIMHSLDAEWGRMIRGGRPFAVLALDIDHFKSLNDEFGHAVGDAVLIRFAGHLRTGLRPRDTVGRSGGEEFLTLLRNTGESDALEIAERMCREVVALADLHPDTGRRVSVSIGVAAASSADTSVDALLRRADAALYRAKAGGRCRVCAAEPPPVARSPGIAHGPTPVAAGEDPPSRAS